MCSEDDDHASVAGFPHSDSSGSSLACSSPKRFAAGRVLLRHVAPRHPPCALICFFFTKRRRLNADVPNTPSRARHAALEPSRTLSSSLEHNAGSGVVAPSTKSSSQLFHSQGTKPNPFRFSPLRNSGAHHPSSHSIHVGQRSIVPRSTARNTRPLPNSTRQD